MEVLEQLSQRCHISSTCKDLFQLLQTPHIQVSSRISTIASLSRSLTKYDFSLSAESTSCSRFDCSERLLSTPARHSHRSRRRRRNGQNCSTRQKQRAIGTYDQSELLIRIFPHNLTNALHGVSLMHRYTTNHQLSTIFY